MLTFRQKRELKLSQRRVLVDSIQIGLASPRQIRDWAERQLPNNKIAGQVTSSKTVDYKTLKPIRDGLFCERIFGPIKDFVCACGKKQPESEIQFCPECEVEYTESRVRRYRLGYINLVSPVTHIWYLQGRPSYLASLLGKKRRSIEAIAYCTTFITEYFSIEKVDSNLGLKNTFHNPKLKKIQNHEKSNSYPNPPYPNYYCQPQTLPVSATFACESTERNFFLDYITVSPTELDKENSYYSGIIRSKPLLSFHELQATQVITRLQAIREILSYTGGEAIKNLINRYEMSTLARFIRAELRELEPEINEILLVKYPRPSQLERLERLLRRRAKQVRRFKLAQLFFRSKKRPEWMILSSIPVLPPELRPIIRLDGDVLVVSDLNKLYQKVLFRNSRFERLGIVDMDSVGYAKRLLQESVDALLDNGKGGSKPLLASNDRPLKSLSDILKGKRGRFRQNLLGKRVDYSGRSVIVVGPKLKLHQCGLPKEMAIELFQPFLVRQLMVRRFAKNIGVAKRVIQEQHPVVWDILQQLMRQHPVLLNRAPTLHRLGIQAFQPKLVNGRAILLHPLVCTAFNADFDGDQMAVHVPLSFQARAEAWKLMWSQNNLLSPATGQPILVPSQDMVLGCYYLTTNIPIASKQKLDINLEAKFFKNFGIYFENFESALKAYNQKQIKLHTNIWIRCEYQQETFNDLENPIEIRVDTFGTIVTIYSKLQLRKTLNGHKSTQFIRTTIGRILVNKIINPKL